MLNRFNLPTYIAIFINKSKSVALANSEVREAISYATNRDEIINTVLNGFGRPAYSPILPGMIGYTDDINKRDFNLDKANKLLDDNGWKRGDDGVRVKNNIPLEINLVTTDLNDELVKTADVVKSQWGKIGAKINIQTSSISDIQQNYIRPREYEALLFGQTLGADPDLFSFWHSSERKDPGRNLSSFGDATSDKLIEDGRAEFDINKRAAIYSDFQKNLNAEIPAIFLYSPAYIYPINKKVQGITIENLVSSSERFSDINKWYINTKRIWK